MSTYTMELRDVIEHIFGETMDPDDWEQPYAPARFNEVMYGKLPTVPDWTKLGLGTYPLFDEEYRPILNGKILDEYFTREIGTETIDNWLLMIRRKMDQIMPYYNKLYLTELIPYNALDTMSIHSVSKALANEAAKANSKSNTVSDTEGKARAVQSQTPQTMLAGREDYATAASDTISETDVKADSTQDSESNTDTTSDTDNLVTGYQAAASDLINKYRASLLNVDTSVILEIQDCFMGLVNNGDAYTSQYPYYFTGWYSR